MPKPTAKPAAKEETPVAAPPKNRKLLTFSMLLLLATAAGGAGWFYTHVPNRHPADAKSGSAAEAKFIPLGENFMVNLQREEGDRNLQAGITLKVLQPELEDRIADLLPEIRSKLLLLLSSKKPSELLTAEGKRKLIAEIIAETDSVLGQDSAPAEAPAAAALETAPAAASAPAVAQPAFLAPKTTGVVDVLFTSFMIQRV